MCDWDALATDASVEEGEECRRRSCSLPCEGRETTLGQYLGLVACAPGREDSEVRTQSAQSTAWKIDELWTGEREGCLHK